MAFVGLRPGARVLLEGATAYLAIRGRLFRMQADEYRQMLEESWDDRRIDGVPQSSYFFAPFADIETAAASVRRGVVLPMGGPLMPDDLR